MHTIHHTTAFHEVVDHDVRSWYFFDMDWNDRFAPLIADIESAITMAYQRGWDDAVQAIMQAAKKPAHSVQSSLPLEQPKQPRTVSDHANGKEAPPLINVVRQFVKDNPGQRGTDVVTHIVSLRPDKDRKLLDRTVRTGLLRLKQREQVISVDGKWYAAEETEAKN